MIRNNLKKSFVFSIICLTSLFLSSCNTSTDSSSNVNNEYTFTYDYNYAGSKNRVVKIGANKRANYYDATRTGYILDGWFNEKECKNEFSFETLINQDTTVYALWTDLKDVKYHQVTFNYNYDDIIKTVEARSGKILDFRKIAKPDRLGYTLEGWYKEKELKNKFDLEKEIITKDIELYAKYKKKDLKFDSNDEVIFDNVKLRIGMYDAFGYYNTKEFKKILEDFNKVYEGKITAEYVTNNGEAANLIFNQTELLNREYDNYYPMSDVLELVNINFRENNYSSTHINNCYIENKLWTMPVASYVPCAIYNKKLMLRYNGNNELPNSGDELIELIQKVNEGESYKENWDYALTMSADWDMREILSNNIYIQNGLELYTVNEDKTASNKWYDDEETPGVVLKAINQFRETFILKNAVGRIKGRYSATTEKRQVQFRKVGSGDAFMGMIGVPGFNTKFGDDIKVWNGPLYNEYLSVMPVSGLFSYDENNPDSQKIYVKNFSFALPKNNSDINKIAAAGVFADYFSKNCSALGERLLYPINKVAQENMFSQVNCPWQVEYILKNIGDSNNFVTYDGHFSEYNVSNEINTDFLIEELFWLPQNATDDVILSKIEGFAKAINKESM